MKKLFMYSAIAVIGFFVVTMFTSCSSKCSADCCAECAKAQTETPVTESVEGDSTATSTTVAPAE